MANIITAQYDSKTKAKFFWGFPQVTFTFKVYYLKKSRKNR